MPMVTQLDEERRRLWEVVEAIWKRCTKGTRILRTSPDERWSLKKGMKCDWTSRIFDRPKV
jgi:hypothetical protein